MKGQKTLAMIVSMSLISIVILMVIGVIQESTTDFRESSILETEMREASIQCSQECSELQADSGESAVRKAASYCAERFSVGEGESKIVGSGYNSFCSDGARCFNVNSCSFRGRELNAEHCRELMCNFLNESGEAEDRVESYFEPGEKDGDFGLGTCDLSGIEDSAGYELNNWWTENFQGEVCEG